MDCPAIRPGPRAISRLYWSRNPRRHPDEKDLEEGVRYADATIEQLWALATSWDTTGEDMRRMIVYGMDVNVCRDGVSLLEALVGSMFATSCRHPKPIEARRKINIVLAAGGRYETRQDKDRQLLWCRRRGVAWPTCDHAYPHLFVLEELEAVADQTTLNTWRSRRKRANSCPIMLP